jgi:hypothetical protein
MPSGGSRLDWFIVAAAAVFPLSSPTSSFRRSFAPAFASSLPLSSFLNCLARSVLSSSSLSRKKTGKEGNNQAAFQAHRDKLY